MGFGDIAVQEGGENTGKFVIGVLFHVGKSERADDDFAASVGFAFLFTGTGGKVFELGVDLSAFFFEFGDSGV